MALEATLPMHKRSRRTWAASTLALVTAGTTVNSAPFYRPSATTFSSRHRVQQHCSLKQSYRSKAILVDPSCDDSRARTLLRLRGGSSSGGGFNPDEWTTPNAPNRQYVEDYGGEDSYYASPNSRRQSDGAQGGGYYNEEEDYDDYGGRRSAKNTNSNKSATRTSSSNDGGLLAAMMPSILKQGDRKIGFMLLASGLAVSFLGFALFMNKTLLRLGNLLLIAGVPMTLGPSRTIGYFVQPEKMRATSCLALGIFLVFIGWPILGILLEVFGLLNLFGNMFPILMVFARQMPVIGPLLQGSSNKNSNSQKSSQGNRYTSDDDYYDDYGGRGGPPQERQRQQAQRQDNYYDDYQDYRDENNSSRPRSY